MYWIHAKSTVRMRTIATVMSMVNYLTVPVFHYLFVSSILDLEGGLDPSIRVDHIAGVINNNDQLRFERMLFRATRGNCLVHMSPIQQVLIDPDSGEEVHKSVFIIFYRSHAIELKVNRIIEAFNAHSYPTPNIQNQIAIENAIKSVTKDLEDSENILKHNMENCESLIENIAKYIIPWKWTVKREKAIYAAMNKVYRHSYQNQ